MAASNENRKDTKELIMRHARAKFLELGFRRVTVEELCRDLRIAKKTFYRHFKNRDDLVLALLADNVQVFVPHMMEILQSDLPTEKRMESYIRFITDVLLRRISQPFLEDLALYMPEYWEKIQEIRSWFILNWEGLIAKGIEDGIFRRDIDPRIATLVIYELVNTVMQPDFLKEHGLTMEETVMTLYNMLMKGIRAEGGPEGR